MSAMGRQKKRRIRRVYDGQANKKKAIEFYSLL
jgi:hypothetical protein